MSDDWTTVASLATAAGTLVLAIATFASVRSANRAARTTERALLAGIRPVLASSRLDDPMQKVGFGDNHFIRVEGGRAAVEVTEEAIYLVIALRNAGNGIAVLDRWDFAVRGDEPDPTHRDPDAFRRLTRDIYVPAGDSGFWQGAFRDPSEPVFIEARTAVEERRTLTVDLLYGDHDGGQRTITRFSLVPAGDSGTWLAQVTRHWNLDNADPR